MARKTKDESPATDQAKAFNATVEGAEPTPQETAAAQAGAAETGEGANAPTRADAPAPNTEGETTDTGAQTPPAVDTPAPAATAIEAGEAGAAVVALATLPQDEPPPPLGEPDPAEFVVVVVGPKGGRWRAGRHFGPEKVEIPVVDLSEDEKAALVDDPRLIVNVIQVPASR